MFFSPITERSTSIRGLYGSLYIILSLLGLTMVIPILIMLAGSVEPGNRTAGISLFPSYVADSKALWDRYIYTKYREQHALLQMAWSDPGANIVSPQTPPHFSDDVALWDKFVAENQTDEFLWAPGFSASGAQVPTYYNRRFQSYLREKYESIEKLNDALGTNFPSFARVNPPPVSLTGPYLESNPLLKAFLEFSKNEVPGRDKFVWDAGGFYRAVFLPRKFGRDISAYNKAHGTAHSSYWEIPFPATAPLLGGDSWHVFVSRFLRPNFIQLTESGQIHFAQSGKTMSEFVRTASRPEDLRVITLDCQFQSWALESHQIADARIPALELDRRAFHRDQSAWRWRFLTQNYVFVTDEILLHGHALTNTLILVALMIAGSLLINPLAAYGLSRFRLKQTYFLLVFFLATIAFPSEVTMIPVFLQLKEFNLLNTFGALVLPTLTNGFSIFLLKGFFDSLPKDIYEAAELDGASEWRMFWLISMNLSKPILAVIGLNAFVAAYSTFFYALILAPDPAMWTIMVYIYQLQQNTSSSVVYASLIISAIPTLLVFVFCQNIILRGIVVPSEK